MHRACLWSGIRRLSVGVLLVSYMATSTTSRVIDTEKQGINKCDVTPESLVRGLIMRSTDGHQLSYGTRTQSDSFLLL